MSPYEERLSFDIKAIESSCFEIRRLVLEAIERAFYALLEGDNKLASETIIGDRKINKLVKELHKKCYHFIVKHLPTAWHLRFVSSTMQLVMELERIGDYAVTICRETVQLSAPLKGNLRQPFEKMSKMSFEALENATQAFIGQDEKLAKLTTGKAELVAKEFDKIYTELTTNEEWERKDLFALLVVFNMLLRISDRTINICEETVFMTSAEVRESKPYNILFLDEDNSSVEYV